MKHISDGVLSNTPMRVRIKKYLPFYLLLLLPLLQVIIFHLLPLYGITIAFKDFKMARGIIGSDWVGMKHFIEVFNDKTFYRVLYNTIVISILTLLTSFPATIIFALMINEIINLRLKRIIQTITYLPHFLSWVVVGGFVYQILSPTNGALNALLVSLNILKEPVYFMAEEGMFIPIYLIANLWKSLGWGVVIYLAAIAGIDISLYEAAVIDGANRFQKVIHVTLPALTPTICTLLILNMGSLMNVGFDPIFNLYNPANYHVSDVISTYVYRLGLVKAQYDYTTAIGLFQNVVGFILILLSNWIARKINPDYKII